MRFTSFRPLTFRRIKKCNIMEKIIIAQLIAHIVADFLAQPASILRYNESKTGKTEYVLIGTLLSFSFALIIGIGISEGVFSSILSFISFIW